MRTPNNFSVTLLNDKDAKDFTPEEAHIAKRLAGGDKDLRTRFEVNVKKGLTPEKAYDAANAAHVKSLDSKQTGLDLGNALKALGYQYKKEDRAKFKAPEVQQTAHAVFNDVFQNKDPEVQAWATKLRDRMLDAKNSPKDAAAAANEFRSAVLKNVDSEDNYTDLTDEQRKQVSSAVRGMEWDKIIPYVKGTSAAGANHRFTRSRPEASPLTRRTGQDRPTSRRGHARSEASRSRTDSARNAEGPAPIPGDESDEAPQWDGG